MNRLPNKWYIDLLPAFVIFPSIEDPVNFYITLTSCNSKKSFSSTLFEVSNASFNLSSAAKLELLVTAL